MQHRRWTLLVGLALALVVVGCGGSNGNTDSATGTDALPGTDAADGTDASGGTDAAMGTDAGGATDAGTSLFTAAITLLDPWANCMPVVGPDPMLFVATIRYTNMGAAPATATITGAELSVLIPGGPPMVQAVTMSPASSGAVPADGFVDVMHNKVNGSGVPPINTCTVCSNGIAFDARLTVMFDVGGVPIAATSAITPVLCTS